MAPFDATAERVHCLFCFTARVWLGICDLPVFGKVWATSDRLGASAKALPQRGGRNLVDIVGCSPGRRILG
jgi:hypothetical protein